MATTQNDTSEFWDFSGLSYGQIENIYQGIKLDSSPILVVSILIALIIAIISPTEYENGRLTDRGYFGFI